MRNRPYIEFLRYARQVTRRADEAEDLLQSVLLSAVEAGRADMTITNNRRWLIGALRKRAMFDARTAARRRKREVHATPEQCSEKTTPAQPSHFVATLPPSLRTTALLALTGHSRTEIAWLQRLSNSALRQRIVAIKRRWRRYGGDDFSDFPGLSGALLFGQIRQALLKPARQSGAFLASHDPDGNLFIICSQKHMARQQ